MKLVCNVNIAYGNLKSESLKIMLRNLNEIVRTFTNSASRQVIVKRLTKILSEHTGTLVDSVSIPNMQHTQRETHA